MMAIAVCRLCLNSNDIVDVFHSDLTNSERLRNCILLATGVNICQDDLVTKHVCSACCKTSIKLYTFRVNALANDRALKVAYRQSQKSYLSEEEMVNKNSELMENVTSTLDELAKPEESHTAHVSVVQLLKTHKDLKIPNELFTVDIDPQVSITRLDMSTVLGVTVCNNDSTEVPDVNLNYQEHRKRPSEENKEVEEKQTKLDDLAVELIVEAPECLRDTQNLNIESRLKPASKVCYKIVESESGKENDEGTNKIVIARIAANDCDDDNSSDYRPETDDSSNSEDLTLDAENHTDSANRQMLRIRKSRPRVIRSDDESTSLVETIDEQDMYNCELCNKSFDHRFKLKLHMRYHKNCPICNIIFRSSNALSYHLRTLCYKQLVSHQPTLCLKRCDDKTEIESIKSQNPSITMNLGNESNQGEVLEISDDEGTGGNPIAGFSQSEISATKSFFAKYRNLPKVTSSTKPTTKDADIQTDNTDCIPDGKFKINILADATVVIERMFPTLRCHRVSVKQGSQEKLSAYIEPNENQHPAKMIDKWCGSIKQLKKKPSKPPVKTPPAEREASSAHTGHVVPQMVAQPQFRHLQPTNTQAVVLVPTQPAVTALQSNTIIQNIGGPTLSFIGQNNPQQVTYHTTPIQNNTLNITAISTQNTPTQLVITQTNDPNRPNPSYSMSAMQIATPISLGAAGVHTPGTSTLVTSVRSQLHAKLAETSKFQSNTAGFTNKSNQRKPHSSGKEKGRNASKRLIRVKAPWELT